MVKQLVVLGAGKSATNLIHYLIKECERNKWHVTIADYNLPLAQSKAGISQFSDAVAIDMNNAGQRSEIIQKGDVIISLLPPSMQFPIAIDCIKYKKHLLTASYLDRDVKSLSEEVYDSGLLFLGEMGLDPGIDHMSAVKWIHEIAGKGGTITSFQSHCGGLVSPESDNNPWHYKISWNPRNIIMAGSMGAAYKENNEIKEIHYNSLFRDCKEVNIPPLGKLACYPNRDSLHYLSTYKLHDAHTFIRTTLRFPAFCYAWHAVVNAGLTSNDLITKKGVTFEKWSEGIRPFITKQNKQQLDYLGLFDQAPVPGHLNTSADVLQFLFERNLSLQENDKDMIVMLHQIEYQLNNQIHSVESSLIVHGNNRLETAMAKTVGLPLGIAAKLMLQDKIHLKGLHIPVLPEIYEPVLAELALHGIRFHDEHA